MTINKKNYWILAAIFMVAKICIHLFSAGVYELHRDEMLYFNMGSHPASGYLTVPPITGMLAFVVKSVFGWSVIGLRLLPALFGVATLYLVARFIYEMKGGITAMPAQSTFTENNETCPNPLPFTKATFSWHPTSLLPNL